MLLKQSYGKFFARTQKTEYIYGRSRTSAPTVIQQPKLSQTTVYRSESFAEAEAMVKRCRKGLSRAVAVVTYSQRSESL